MRAGRFGHFTRIDYSRRFFGGLLRRENLFLVRCAKRIEKMFALHHSSTHRRRSVKMSEEVRRKKVVRHVRRTRRSTEERRVSSWSRKTLSFDHRHHQRIETSECRSKVWRSLVIILEGGRFNSRRRSFTRRWRRRRRRRAFILNIHRQRIRMNWTVWGTRSRSIGIRQMWRRKHQLTGRRTFSTRRRRRRRFEPSSYSWIYLSLWLLVISLSFFTVPLSGTSERWNRDRDRLCDRSTKAMERENRDHRRPYLMKEQHDRKDHQRTRTENGNLEEDTKRMNSARRKIETDWKKVELDKSTGMEERDHWSKLK